MGMTFAGRVIQEPGPELDTCRLLGFPTDWAELANRFENPLGTRSGVGHVLMWRQDLDVLNAAGLLNQPNDLTASDSINTRTLKNLHVVSTRCITPGYPNDPAAVHLVELADRRRILRLAYTTGAVSMYTGFNMRETPGGNYRTGTATSATVAYTWQEVIDKLKTLLLASGLPTASDFTLPVTPDGSPEGMRFGGWRVMEALGWVLDRLGFALKWDPFQDVYTIVRPGQTQLGLSDAETAYLSARMLDVEPVSTWYGSVPLWVRVLFRKQGGREDAYGDDPFAEKRVSRSDLGLDLSTSFGEEILFDDLPALYQGDTLTNDAALLTRAQARAREFWTIRENFQGQAYRKAYTGFLAAFETGSQVRSVAWQDMAGGEHEGGPLTIVDRTPYQPDRFARWPAHADGHGAGGGNEDGRPAGVPGRPWRLVGLADPYPVSGRPGIPTGYEDYVLEDWRSLSGSDQTQANLDIWRPSNSLLTSPTPPREVAVFSGFRDGRPVYLTVTEARLIDNAAPFTTTLILGGGSQTFLVGATAGRTVLRSGPYLINGFIRFFSLAGATLTFTWSFSTGTGTVCGLASFSSTVAAGGSAYVPINQIMDVTTVPAVFALKIDVSSAGNAILSPSGPGDSVLALVKM